jgi:hypothetical protein
MSEYGPYEYYHNEDNEPMFRGIKVINLAEMFSKEEIYWDYTLEQFKDWLIRVTPTDDWTYIVDWGRLNEFDSISLSNKDIYNYIFQLGMSPIYTYISCISSIEGYERDIKNPIQKYNYCSDLLQEAKDLLEVCKKYMSGEDVIYALELREDMKYV